MCSSGWCSRCCWPLEARSSGYRVELQGHELDADRFETLLARGRKQLEAVPERAVGRLDEALGLWRGAAFGELATRDAVRAEAVRLGGLRATAAAFRIDARPSIGDHQAVIAEPEQVGVVDLVVEGDEHRELLGVESGPLAPRMVRGAD